MALPKLKTNIFEIFLEYSGEKILVHQFTAAHEKMLIFARSSDNIELGIDIFKQILSECIVSPKDFDVESIPYFALGYIFSQLRGYSVDERLPLIGLKCEKCNTIGKETTIENLDNTKRNVIFNEDKNSIHVNVIQDIKYNPGIETFSQPIKIGETDCGKNIYIKLKYMTYDVIREVEKLMSLKNEKLENKKDGYKEVIDIEGKLLYLSTDSIFDDEDVYEFSEDEFINFYYSIPESISLELGKIMHESPHYYYDINFKCKNCGHDNINKIRDIHDFFM